MGNTQTTKTEYIVKQHNRLIKYVPYKHYTYDDISNEITEVEPNIWTDNTKFYICIDGVVQFVLYTDNKHVANVYNCMLYVRKFNTLKSAQDFKTSLLPLRVGTKTYCYSDGSSKTVEIELQLKTKNDEWEDFDPVVKQFTQF